MRTSGTREIVVVSVALVAAGRLVDGPPAAFAGVALLLGVAFATLQVLADDDPTAAAAGVPIESLITPATAAFAGLVAIRLVPIGLWLVPALAFLGWFVRRAVTTEARILRSRSGPSEGDRTAVLVEIVAIAVVGFTGIAALVPGGLADPASGAANPAPGTAFVALAIDDGLLAALLGYRAAALRSRNLRDVLWEAVTTGGLIGISAAAVRAIEAPRLLGPALLTLVLFLWDTAHSGTPSRRRDPRRIWEAALLVALGLVVVVWSSGARG